MLKKFKRLTLVPTSLIALSCLLGCETQTPDYSWVKPIYLEPETTLWLSDRIDEWPDSLVKDLNKIEKHNMKVLEVAK